MQADVAGGWTAVGRRGWGRRRGKWEKSIITRGGRTKNRKKVTNWGGKRRADIMIDRQKEGGDVSMEGGSQFKENRKDGWVGIESKAETSELNKAKKWNKEFRRMRKRRRGKRRKRQKECEWGFSHLFVHDFLLLFAWIIYLLRLMDKVFMCISAVCLSFHSVRVGPFSSAGEGVCLADGQGHTHTQIHTHKHTADPPGGSYNRSSSCSRSAPQRNPHTDPACLNRTFTVWLCVC